MRKWIVACCLTLFALPAWAQTIAQVYFARPKPGHEQAYEEGRKKHAEWHKKQNDTWTWRVFEVIMGENTGSYIISTPGHEWKDFDGREAFEQADSADAAANLAPHQDSAYPSLWVMRGDMSVPAASTEPAAFSQVTHFYVKPEGVTEFAENVKKISEAIKKSNWGTGLMWYQLVSGGEGPRFVLSVGRKDWASFAPPEKSLSDMLASVYGAEQGTAMLQDLRKHIRYTRTYVSRYRADLSYVPAGK